ncbi:MAG TPA: TonB-dependent receptor plug domain-containing protein, partial [Lacunisphaera sp.]|nr:TonB-dependent receptor plug domain-containing protein [Lacunisphaera sp.]
MQTQRSLADILLAIALAAITSPVSAQTTGPDASNPDRNPGESTLVLSPFVVTADEDLGYAARSTLAGTRIRTDLRDVGSSISVVTKQFLEDTNSTSIESLLVYTANTEVSGEGGNFLGKGDGAILTSPPGTSTRVRGLTSADNTRDFYLSDIPFDSYNTGRVDIQRGPNAI